MHFNYTRIIWSKYVIELFDTGGVEPLRGHKAGRLGGSVGQASNFGSGHDLTVRGFKPHIRLCADSSEPGACFRFCLLSLCPSLLMLCLCLSKMNKR